jgi:methanogenic corrinoid protein MtbC1
MVSVLIPNIEATRERLYGTVVEADRMAAAELLNGATENFGYRPVIEQLLEPVLRLVGERFVMDRISLAQGYVAGKIAEDLLARMEDSYSASDDPKLVAVIGNAEDDYHALGRRMVGTFLKIDGWRVHDLGNDVVAPSFVDTAEDVAASVIGVSAMMLTNARNIAKVREEIEKRGLGGRIKLAVGGAVFTMRPELVAEVGGDGSASYAVNAPELFRRLAAQTVGAR